ncbi:hypothetical protein D3C87_2188430 [compost metagenome]
MENATANGYRQNCTNEQKNPAMNSTSSGTCCMIASGNAANARLNAKQRINSARS